jgi:hypothetical protein
MAQKIARQIVLAARPQGRPKPSDFRLRKPRSLCLQPEKHNN